jgi:hypothetical protein
MSLTPFSPSAPDSKSARSGRRARYIGTLAGVLTLAACSPALAAAPEPGQPFYENGCTVEAKAPYTSGISLDLERIARFQVNFTCSASVSSIAVRMRGYETDANESNTDDLLLFTSDFGPYNVPPRGGSGAWARTIPVQYWDGLGDEEVELRTHVRFKVCSGLTCAWSPAISPNTWVTGALARMPVDPGPLG